MSSRNEFLRSQKVLRLTTIDPKNIPHIVPVWYMYSAGKVYVGTNTKTQKAKNIKKNNKVAFCVDVGIKSPNIYGVLGQGKANLILEESKVKRIATRILLRYFKSMKSRSAQELLDETDVVIEIIPERFSVWSY